MITEIATADLCTIIVFLSIPLLFLALAYLLFLRSSVRSFLKQIEDALTVASLEKKQETIQPEKIQRQRGWKSPSSDKQRTRDPALRCGLGFLSRIDATQQRLNNLPSALQGLIEDIDSERMLAQSLLNSMSDGVLCMDEAGIIVFQNPALDPKILPKGARGKLHYQAIKNPELLEKSYECLRMAESGSQSKASELFSIQAGKRSYRVAYNKIASEEDSKNLHLFVFTDWSSEERLKREREELLQYASHELKTPVTSIYGYTCTLLEKSKNPAERNFLGIILRNTKRMQLLIEDMVRISSIESGAYPFDPQWLSVQDTIDSLKAVVMGDLSQKKQNLQFHIDGKESIFADPLLLEHLLVNLLTNASRYSPEATEISVSFQTDSNVCKISVLDEGIGIPAKYRKRIFRRFYRIDQARSRREGGTGLGLSIVRQIVRLHKGRIWVEDRPDGRPGSVFEVRLPLPKEASSIK